ncbi:helix-turn-helix domain-containing protein [Nocardia sp. NPDC057030]|uniref:AraC family transcriptional regulator n=1 Tax=unclassified Nocardia TaxID=2637762 RepID=UPI0036310AAD
MTGLLHPGAGDGAYHERMSPSPPDLTDVVSHFWHVRWDLSAGRGHNIDVLPPPCIQLVVEGGVGRVHGVARGKYHRRLTGAGEIFGITLRPAAFGLFSSIPVRDLTERVVSADILDITLPVSVARAEAVIRAHVRSVPERVLFVNSIIDAIETDRTLTTVDSITQRFNIGKRYLQQLFRTHIGVSPKWVIQRFRLQEAAMLIDTGATSLAQLSADLGYADQAHFTRDFAAVVGYTPGTYRSANS